MRVTDYKNGIIVQFKNEEHLIRNLKWNKEYAKIMSNEIGIIEEKALIIIR
jgi:hypothetical protein